MVEADEGLIYAKIYSIKLAVPQQPEGTANNSTVL
jgi:hypothetical protein